MRDAVRRVAKEIGLDVSVAETVVGTQQAAIALQFPGSPTVRVWGHDLQPDATADFGLG